MADFNSSCRARRRLAVRSGLWLIMAFLWVGLFAWIFPPASYMHPDVWFFPVKITVLSMLLALGTNQYRYLLQLEQGAERGELPGWAERGCFDLTEPLNRTGFRRVRVRGSYRSSCPPPHWRRGQYDSMITILSRIFGTGCLVFLSLALDLTPVSWAGLSPDALPYYSVLTFLASGGMLTGLFLDFFGQGYDG